jgi:copper homeostasis protein
LVFRFLKMARVLLEVCVDDAAGLAAAVAGGADRIELCSALAVGGITPSTGLMMLAAQVPIPVVAMIRPRAGSFVYSPEEISIMLADIDQARTCGLAGIVLGASNKDGTLNLSQLHLLADAAVGMEITLHRAFDLVPDFCAAIDVAIELGFKRILTSGGEKIALDGIDQLANCIAHAAGRIEIMPGGGIDVDSAMALRAKLPLKEIHASCSSLRPESDISLLELGFSSAEQKGTDQSKVEALKRVLG